MSYVYTVTIQMDDNDSKEKVAIEKLNEYLKAQNHLGGKFIKIMQSYSAGTKSPERSLLWGGLNFLHCDEFIALFKSLDLDDALLTIAHPEHDSYRVIASKTRVELE